MNYEEVVSSIETKRRFGQACGREVTQEMMGRLHYPEDGMQIIHIAGTNGKGSTAAFVSSILQAAGFVVGRFTSPHLVTFRERIVVAGEMISEDDVVRLGNELLNLDMTLEATMFDLCLGIAILYFKEKKCDYVVLETGLGGAKDSTAGLRQVPLVCGFTNIGFDHTAILGNTIEEIAGEKAGILKTGTKAVLGIMSPQARKVIEKRAAKLSVPTQNVDNLLTKISTMEIGLNGGFQRYNAALAVGIVEALFNQKSGYLLDNFIEEGLRKTRWAGRMECMQENPRIIIDGAHNPQGVEALFNSLKEAFPNEKFVFLMGVMADKDYVSMARQMLPLVDEFLTVTVESNRALQSKELADQLNALGAKATPCEDLLEAMKIGKALARERKEVLVAFGSLYFIGEIEKLYR